MARPINLWGNPDNPTFYHDYVTMVTFCGHKVPWHKWAVSPLKMVEADIMATSIGRGYFSRPGTDLQVYNNRFIAGTKIKSNHAWALAMDINPTKNPFRKPLTTDIPAVVRQAFQAHGFNWGGNYSTPDTMHFEYLGQPVVVTMSPGQWLDFILKARDSELSAAVLLQMEKNYGIKPIWTLVITGAETSCGAREAGAMVTEAHNYGCMRASSRTTKWGSLALSEELHIAAGDFFKFKDVWTGAAALGRLLKVGPADDPGFYLRALQRNDWEDFAEVYNPGSPTYPVKLREFEAGFRRQAEAVGVSL